MGRLDRRLNSRHSPIHILNDDVLFNIFHLYRLSDPEEYDGEYGTVISWDHQRWWYDLAHVCRRWRYIILESPSRLDLHLYFTNGVPVADMLAHFPTLSLAINYHTDREMTVQDESGLLLALSQRDRVRRVYFWRLQDVGKFVKVMDNQFPVLECMYIHSRDVMTFPETFQAPNLRHLRVWTPFLSTIGSPLLTTTVTGLVNLSLFNIPPSARVPPSYILTRISLMAQLERLSIGFLLPRHNRELERELRQTPNMTTLPNLRWFIFRGMASYLEGLVARISAPSLDILQVYSPPEPSCTVTRLLQFMRTSKNLTFGPVQVTFGSFAVSIHAVPWKWNTPLMLEITCKHLDLQVESAVQLFGTLSPVLSVVETVAFSYEKYDESPESHRDVDRRQWRELLRPFTNAKTIHVQDDLVREIIRSLPSDDGEPPLEILPDLEEVGYSGESGARDAFTRFLNERQVAGHPVSLRLVDHSMFNEPR